MELTMSENHYDYLLPIFVGHPFQAEYTKDLRDVIERACDKLNNEQTKMKKKYIWKPEFLNTIESSNPTTILEAVRESIREAALCLFDISDVSKVNIFFELGIAVGMQRSLALLARAPYTAPSDLQGLRRIG